MEIDNMRAQMKEIKEALKKSNIVSRETLSKLIQQETSWLNKTFLGAVIATPFILLIVLAEVLMSGISMWFFYTIAIAVIIDLFINYKTMVINRKDIIAMNLQSLKLQLMKQKKNRYWQYLISVPLGIIWAALFIYSYSIGQLGEELKEYPAAQAFVYIGIGLCIISIIWLCTYLYKKMQRTNDEIIQQIDAASL